MSDIVAPPLPIAAVKPAAIVIPADSWQAQLLAEIEAAHRSKNDHCLTVIIDRGPVRWYVGRPRKGVGSGIA